MSEFDFGPYMGPTARAVLGEPNERLSTKEELRFGTNGSLSVDLTKGTWYDHEACVGGGVLDFLRERKRLINGAALDWLKSEIGAEIPDGRAEVKPNDGKGRIVATYDYFGEDGALVFQVCRKEPKTFLQRRPDNAGGWVWSTKGIRQVPYRLPELMASDAEADPVFIAEGEKDVDALRALGIVATCNAGGAGKWRKELNSHFAGRNVIVLPDNDPPAVKEDGSPRLHPDGSPVLPGQDHAEDVARQLTGVASRVRILMLPNLPLKGDPSDWITAGGTLEQLVDLVEAAPEIQAPAKAKVKRARPSRATEGIRAPSSLPTIRIIAGLINRNADEAEDALIAKAADQPVYQRGNDLVMPISREVAASHGRTTVAAGFAELNAHALIDIMCSVAEFEKFDGRSGEWVRSNPPKAIADILLARVGRWRVAVVAGVVTTPTMRPDGSLMTAPGYDVATRLYHVVDPALKLHPAVQKPTRETALGALEALKALLVEFPFVETTTEKNQTKRVSLAVALSGMITPVVRGALPVAPLTAYRANTAGSGKSYLADIGSAIATARPCPVISAAPGDEVETEKRLVGLLQAGFPIISLDNVNDELGGDLLCQAVERPIIRLRILGSSNIIEIESRATVFATGNNMRIRGDMVRRTLVADLDAGMERPELREFKSDPVATVLADRGRYVSACLIIVRAYLLAGMPGKLKPIASFEAWSDLVRSALVWLGCDDPAESMEAARADDPELASIREMAAAWDSSFGGSIYTLKKAIEAAKEQIGEADENGDRHRNAHMVFRYPDLLPALTSVAGGVRGEVDNHRLGKWMARFAGKVVVLESKREVRFFKLATLSGGVAQWKLQYKTDDEWS